jgi:hypothetical protein
VRLLVSIDRNEPQQSEIAQHFPGAQDDGSERIVRNRNGQTGFLAYALIEILDQRATTRKHDAAIADVRGKLRRGALESYANRVEDRSDAFG